jgi:hypothetical protein
MDEFYAIVGKLYLELYQAQKMIEVQNQKLQELSKPPNETK